MEGERPTVSETHRDRVCHSHSSLLSSEGRRGEGKGKGDE
jgi:hypothetical protein